MSISLKYLESLKFKSMVVMKEEIDISKLLLISMVILIL